MFNEHRLCELVPTNSFDHECSYHITFINYGKNIETHLVNTREEALKLYAIWIERGFLPEKCEQ